MKLHGFKFGSMLQQSKHRLKANFYLAIKYLSDPRSKSWLFILTFSSLFFLLVTTALVIDNLESNLKRPITGNVPKTIFLLEKNSNSFYNSKLQYRDIYLNTTTIKIILPVLENEGYIVEKNKSIKIKASTIDYFQYKNYEIKGSFIKEKNETLIGNLLADMLNIKINDIIHVIFNENVYKLKITGIFKSNQIDDGILFIDIRLIWETDNEYKEKVNYYEIILNVDNKNDFEKILKDLNDKIGNNVKVIYNDFSTTLNETLSFSENIIQFWSIFLYLGSFLTGFVFFSNIIKRIRKEISILYLIGSTKINLFLIINFIIIILIIISAILSIAVSFIVTSILFKSLSVILQIKIVLIKTFSDYLLINILIFIVSCWFGAIIVSLLGIRKGILGSV